MKLFLASLLASAALVAPAFADGDLPDGTYHCATADGVSLGDLRIEGGDYRASVGDGNWTDPSMYIVMDGGKIEWLGTMPGFETAAFRIDSSTIVTEGGAARIDIVVLADGASDFTTASCIS